MLYPTGSTGERYGTWERSIKLEVEEEKLYGDEGNHQQSLVESWLQTTGNLGRLGEGTVKGHSIKQVVHVSE